MTKAYDKCKDILGSNSPKDLSMGWFCHTPAIYLDMDFVTPADCHNLKEELTWEWKVPEVDDQVKTALAFVAIFAILILFMCGIQRLLRTKTDRQQIVEQQEKLLRKRRKKFNLKRLMRRSCRICCVQTEKQVRKHELRTRKQVDVHKEHSQRKLAQWNTARERYVQRKKEKLERRKNHEND
ncbi:hypothetical protein KR200_002239 [Drosophila serrata]|nr:hypothetical protein KR200_002239 [Drosophila serrata]